MTKTDSLLEIAKCPEHKVQCVYQIPHTKEQKFVGASYKCPICNFSVLYPSKQLQEFLSEQKNGVSR